MTLLDTADMYGHGANEELVGKAIAARRDQAIVATKFGIVRRRTRAPVLQRQPRVRARSCEASLQRLGIDVIDLYQLHRVDPDVPIEETVGAMTALVDEGKVRYIGLSEALEEDIRRAAAVAPDRVAPERVLALRAQARGRHPRRARSSASGCFRMRRSAGAMLTGRIQGLADLGADDARHRWPRFAEENIDHNLGLVGRLEAFAADKGVTAGQLALAWLLAQREWIVPIPGTKRVAYLEENAAAAEVDLTPAELALIDEAVPRGSVPGSAIRPERMPTWTSAPR